MIRKILLLVSLFLFFCTTLNQNCAPSLANDLIQTGMSLFMKVHTPLLFQLILKEFNVIILQSTHLQEDYL